MFNKILKHLSFTFLFISIITQLQAQVSESCTCTVDTLGYQNFIQTLTPNEEATFQFHISGTFAVAYGVIGSSTPNVVQDLIDNHPDVTTIVMYACPGSEDDESNLEASQLIHDANYKMYLPLDGWIASGATDMFLAGSTRVVEITPDAVGVHSWSDGTNEATDFPVGHEYHQFYIDYYISMGFSTEDAENFYYFTINSAPANNIYWMTDAEIDQYKIRTCKYSDTPTYSVSANESSLTADLAGASYQWIDCADFSTIDNATNQSYTPIMDGSYAVQITEETCMGTSDCFSLASVSIIENDFKSELQIYPNPTLEKYSVHLDHHYSSITVTLSNLAGELLQSDTYTHKQLIDLSITQPAGIYYLTIEAGDKKAVVRLVKE